MSQFSAFLCKFSTRHLRHSFSDTFGICAICERFLSCSFLLSPRLSVGQVSRHWQSRSQFFLCTVFWADGTCPEVLPFCVEPCSFCFVFFGRPAMFGSELPFFILRRPGGFSPARGGGNLPVEHCALCHSTLCRVCTFFCSLERSVLTTS
jgi:hypothetical protein